MDQTISYNLLVLKIQKLFILIQILGGQLEQLKVCGLNYDRVKKVKKKKKTIQKVVFSTNKIYKDLKFKW